MNERICGPTGRIGRTDNRDRMSDRIGPDGWTGWTDRRVDGCGAVRCGAIGCSAVQARARTRVSTFVCQVPNADMCAWRVFLPCMALAAILHMPPVSAQTLPRKCSISGTVETDSTCNRAHVAYVAVSGMLTMTTGCDGVFSFRDTEVCAPNGSVHVLRHNAPEFRLSLPTLPVHPLRLQIPSGSLTGTCAAPTITMHSYNCSNTSAGTCAACPSAPTINCSNTSAWSLSSFLGGAAAAYVLMSNDAAVVGLHA